MSEEIHPFRIEIPAGRPRLPARPAGHRPLARTVAGRGLDPGRAARLPHRARRPLARGLRLARPGGEAQPVPPVHHRDRRPADPLPAGQVRPAGRDAAADHARFPELGRRVPAPHRAAGRPGRRAGVPRRRAVPARLRLLHPAERDRLDDGTHRPRLGRADAPTRLPAVRRARRRHRRRRVRPGRRPRRRARHRRPRGDRPDDRRQRGHVHARPGRPAGREATRSTS